MQACMFVNSCAAIHTRKNVTSTKAEILNIYMNL